MHNRFWFLLSKKLNSTATDLELSELDDMLLENADWQFAVQQVNSIWEANPDEGAPDTAFEKHLGRMNALGHNTAIFREDDTIILKPLFVPAKKTYTRQLLVFGSLFIILAGCLWFATLTSKAVTTSPDVAKSNKSIVTKSGDRTKMLLPDSTQVWLNAESKLEYNKEYGISNRDVKLSGEAYFDVVKNAKMPFTIQTNKIYIKVTGTVFNVKAYPGEKVSETSLIRGRVEVTVNARPDEKYILKPNEKLVVRDEDQLVPVNKTARLVAERKANEPLILLGHLNYLENDSASIETSWVYNRLIFDDLSFGEIANKMARWYGVKINITDPGIAAQQLTYTIKNETIEQALDNMKYALRFHYNLNGKTITITK
ncbi:MAG: FecR family protein [Bacteroidota bacterium]